MNWREYNLNLRRSFLRLEAFIALLAMLPTKDQTLGETDKTGLHERPRWTTSRVIGSPDAPPPYTVKPVFTQIAWKNPVFAICEPDSEWLIFVEWPQLIAEPADSKGNDNKK